MPSEKAILTPSVLLWARQTAGYEPELAARKMNITVERLMSWEMGDDQPTVKQARDLAVLYRRPLAIFYLPDPPPIPLLPTDYRQVEAVSLGLGPQARYEIRLARYRRDLALSLLDEMGDRAPTFTVTASLDERPEIVASRLRQTLGIATDTQVKWKTDSDALRAWRIALERNGVLVFQTATGRWGVTPEELRGVAIFENPFPVVLLNGRDSPRARMFTLMHEYTHLALNTSGICDWAEQEKIEVFCNHVAGAILVPEMPLRSQVPTSDPTGSEVTDEQLESAAQRFHVSREVIARRLLILGCVSRSFYQAKHVQYREEHEAIKKQPKKKKKILVPPHIKALGSNGYAFAGLVVRSYYRGEIGPSHISTYLGLSFKHFANIERALAAHSVGGSL